MKKNSILLLLILGITFFSNCSKNNDTVDPKPQAPQGYSGCVISKIIDSSSTDTFSYNYDSNRKIIRISQSSPGFGAGPYFGTGPVTYSGNNISYNFDTKNLWDSTKILQTNKYEVTVGSIGYPSSIKSGSTTYNYTYDNNGYCTGVDIWWGSTHYNYFCYWTDGNLTKITVAAGSIYDITFTYDLNKPDNLNNYLLYEQTLIVPQLIVDYAIPGKPSKNLLTGYSDKNEIVNFSYQFDSRNNPVKRRFMSTMLSNPIVQYIIWDLCN